MQAEFLHRFETVQGFGFERTARPHFRYYAPALTWQGSSYRVIPPQLIGLEDKPTAFLPLLGQETTLRQMTNSSLRKLMKSRLLTEFETNAVRRVIAGEPLVAQLVQSASRADLPASGPDQLQILAAVKAGPTCAECHECAEGKLLGAFSYTLERVGPNNDALPAQSKSLAFRSAGSIREPRKDARP
jgi:hypothetical protein